MFIPIVAALNSSPTASDLLEAAKPIQDANTLLAGLSTLSMFTLLAQLVAIGVLVAIVLVIAIRRF